MNDANIAVDQMLRERFTLYRGSPALADNGIHLGLLQPEDHPNRVKEGGEIHPDDADWMAAYVSQPSVVAYTICQTIEVQEEENGSPKTLGMSAFVSRNGIRIHLYDGVGFPTSPEFTRILDSHNLEDLPELSSIVREIPTLRYYKHGRPAQQQ